MWYVDSKCYFSFESIKCFSDPSADDAKDKEILSRTILDQIYGPLQKEVDESLKMQESVMSQIQVGVAFMKYLNYVYH